MPTITLPSAPQSRTGQVPIKYQAMYRKAMTPRAGKAIALKVMCYECMGWEHSEVKHCVSTSCPLWQHRPAKAGSWEAIVEYHARHRNTITAQPSEAVRRLA